MATSVCLAINPLQTFTCEKFVATNTSMETPRNWMRQKTPTHSRLFGESKQWIFNAVARKLKVMSIIKIHHTSFALEIMRRTFNKEFCAKTYRTTTAGMSFWFNPSKNRHRLTLDVCFKEFHLCNAAAGFPDSHCCRHEKRDTVCM